MDIFVNDIYKLIYLVLKTLEIFPSALANLVNKLTLFATPSGNIFCIFNQRWINLYLFVVVCLFFNLVTLAINHILFTVVSWLRTVDRVRSDEVNYMLSIPVCSALKSSYSLKNAHIKSGSIYYLCSKAQTRWGRNADVQADLNLCCLCIKEVFSQQG